MTTTTGNFFITIFIVVLFLNISGCARLPVNMRASKQIVLVNGTLIDGTGKQPLTDAIVIIQEGKIKAVGKKISIPKSARIIDIEGGTILPGFINTHVHRSFNIATLQLWAQQGVTTVRDLGNGRYPEIFRFRDRIRNDPYTARLVAAGPIITVPGGYPSRSNSIAEEDALIVYSSDDAREKINWLFDSGADLIKISLESFEYKIPVLTIDETKIIVETAHARGGLVSAHVTFSGDLVKALEAGVDDIAHMITDRLSDDLIERVIKADVYWVPTIYVWMRGGEGLPDMNPLQDPVVDNLKRFVAAGGKVALGTDYGPPIHTADLGMPLHEIFWMHEAGMTPMQIIIAATKNAAHVCNLGEEIGTIEPGKAADVLVVDGNPLDDLSVLGKTKIVIKGGKIIRYN